jgi:hypothetical protein
MRFEYRGYGGTPLCGLNQEFLTPFGPVRTRIKVPRSTLVHHHDTHDVGIPVKETQAFNWRGEPMGCHAV